MLAEALNRALAARGIHYGWAMVALAFVYSLFASASLGVPAVLIQPMSQELGWSIGELSGPQGLRFALFGLAAPFAGGLMLRYGPRRMLGIAGVLVLGGLLLTVLMTERWQMWLGLGMVLGLAPGLTALQLGAVISTRWFANRRHRTQLAQCRRRLRRHAARSVTINKIIGRSKSGKARFAQTRSEA